MRKSGGFDVCWCDLILNEYMKMSFNIQHNETHLVTKMWKDESFFYPR